MQKKIGWKSSTDLNRDILKTYKHYISETSDQKLKR